MTPTQKGTQTSAKGTTPIGKKTKGWTNEERAAMQERAREMKAGEADGESAVLAKIAAMKGADRAMGQHIHEIVKASAPSLSPKTWYGMPAYANEEGKIICFFQPAQKFKMRYAMLGFSDKANLDEGNVWPVYYAVKELTATDEAKVGALVKKAVS